MNPYLLHRRKAFRQTGDPFWANVVFLQNFQGTNGSKPATDQSQYAHALAWNGDAVISTAQSPFAGGSSLALDGNDRVDSPASSNFDLGSSPLTIEMWVYISASSNANTDGLRDATVISTLNSGGGVSGWALLVTGSAANTGTGLGLHTWSSSNGTLFRVSTAIAQGQWHHIATTVEGGVRRLFLNGNLLTGSQSDIGAGYNPVNSFGNPLRLGAAAYLGYESPLNGYIASTRITKGVARYTANFTPPTAPFPTGP